MPRLTFLFLLFFTAQAFAQPKLYFSVDTTVFSTGEIATLDLQANEFNRLQEMRFSLRWNPDVLQVDPATAFTNFHPDLNIDPDNFIVNNQEGYFTFAWREEQGFSCNYDELDLPDGSVLFSISFTGAMGGSSEIYITDEPAEIYLTNLTSCPINIFCNCLDAHSFVEFLEDPSAQRDLSAQGLITIFPNPAESVLHWSVTKKQRLQIVRIVDLFGKEWGTLISPTGNTLNISHLPAGYYLLELSWVNGQTAHQPFIKQ